MSEPFEGQDTRYIPPPEGEEPGYDLLRKKYLRIMKEVGIDINKGMESHTAQALRTVVKQIIFHNCDAVVRFNEKTKVTRLFIGDEGTLTHHDQRIWDREEQVYKYPKGAKSIEVLPLTFEDETHLKTFTTRMNQTKQDRYDHSLPIMSDKRQNQETKTTKVKLTPQPA